MHLSSAVFKVVLAAFLLCCCHLISFGQAIPKTYKVDWSKAGLQTEIIYDTTISLTQFGGIGDGFARNDSAMALALDYAKGKNANIYIPPGTWNFSSTITLPDSVGISGAGRDTTILRFDHNQEAHSFAIQGNALNSTKTFFQDSTKKGDAFISIVNTSAFSVGDIVRLVDLDTAKIFSSWANGTSGQFLTIKSVDSSRLFFNETIRRNYSMVDQPFVVKINPRRNVKLEKFKMIRLDTAINKQSNFYIRYAYNCAMHCIESENVNFAHFEIRESKNILLEGNYIHHAFNYGGGGRAYGIALEFGSSDVLLTNNILHRLRHSILIQAGANGNVISYNYSFDPFWSGTGLPDTSAGDIVFHGNYPYANLVEGNICQNLVTDISHGLNGPWNMSFRNRAELYGIFTFAPPSPDSQAYVGNEINNPSSALGWFYLLGDDHLVQGNNVKGAPEPAGSRVVLESSLYLNTPPIFNDTTDTWPPFGYPNEGFQNENEAYWRYHHRAPTPCDEAKIIPIEPTSVQNVENQFLVYPNPANTHVNIEFSQNEMRYVRIRHINGQIIQHFNRTRTLDIVNLPSGVYVIRIEDFAGEFHFARFIKQ